MPIYEKVDFETGFVSTNIPVGTEIAYQVDVPADAVHWVNALTNSFQPLESGVDFPRSCHTDTVHTVEGKDFYRVEVETQVEVRSRKKRPLSALFLKS